MNSVLVTSLPRDRLSQVTRRGMLTDTKGHTKLNAARQSEERHVSYQRKTGLSDTPSGGAAVERGIPREQTRMKESEKVNLWESISEVNRPLGSEESNIVRVAFPIAYETTSERNITVVVAF